MFASRGVIRVNVAGVAVLGAVFAGVMAIPAPGNARVPSWPTVSGLPRGMARPATVSTDSFLDKMRSRLERRVSAAALGDDVSVQVEDLVTGDRDYGHRSKQGQIPASTQKTATALAVLSAAGADRRMPTTVKRSSSGGVLTLVGGGDPLLSSRNLSDLAQDAAAALREQGLPSGKIRLKFDDSLFADVTSPPGWYSSYYTSYAALPMALTRDLRGVSDGALDAARYFRTQLKDEGVKVKRRVRRTAAGADRTLVSFRGHTVAEAIWPMLHYSDNSIAELMIRHVARARKAPTTAAGSAAAVEAELRSLDVPVKRARIVDGSGLSTSDRLSARTLTGIVRASMNPSRPDLSIGYRTSAMPLAGYSGTLSSRFSSRRTKCAAGRVMAKTGTLSSSVALAGVAASEDGRARAFAVVVNHPRGSLDRARYRVDRIVTAIAGCK